ncbi:MAG: CotH kinase family protein [Bacteroidaceae bacterium]|nr:CotH kinase family protein [Bacteroidaceae bacterium]
MKLRIIWCCLAMLVGMSTKADDTLGLPLISDAWQLSSNASDWQEGQHLEYLIDGKSNTFWHTDWHGQVSDKYHYLQVELKEAFRGHMVIYMLRRNTPNDHPTQMIVEASNDAKEWTSITTVDFPYDGPVTPTCSEAFTLHKEYKFIRVAATDCTGANNYGYRVYWHAAEFQLYPAYGDLPFIPTQLVNGDLHNKTVYYTMTIRGNKKIFMDGDRLRCLPTEAITPAHLWAFTGNPTDGFRVYNFSTGATCHAYVSSSDNRTYVQMVPDTRGSGTDVFMLSSNWFGGYNFYFPGVEKSCWNDFNNENVIATWNNSSAPNDNGSNIVFEEFDAEALKHYVKEISLNPKGVTLYSGESMTLTYTIEPQDATNKNVDWSSSNEDIVKVDANGQVTAVAPGIAYVIATAKDGSNVSDRCRVIVMDGDALEALTGDIAYLYRADGKVEAYPQIYIKSLTQDETGVKLTLEDDTKKTFKPYEVDSVSTIAPEFPTFTSFKFNNKFNDQLIGDSEGVISEDGTINLTVIGIGRRLTASFKTSSDDASAYIGNELQVSKVSRPRFNGDVTYTVARRGQTILRKTVGGKLVEYPLGRDYTVHVDFLTDHPKGEYNVPTIHINTMDGTMISSKNRYWDALIWIDGAGVFPSLQTMPMHIRGRGNSSWAGEWGKSPYRIKFDEKVKVLGLPKGKNWNLIANAQRESMTCNAIGQRAAQMVGAAAANHEIPVELYINGNYRGSYNLTEKIGFSNNSIDLEDETNAVLLELDTYYDEDYKFMTSSYQVPVNIKEPDLTEEAPETNLAFDDIYSHFNAFTSGLYNGDDISNYVDVDFLARYLFVNDLIENFEFMHPKSTYLYNENITDPESKYIWGPAWDLDWAFGYEQSGTYFRVDATRNYWNGINMEMDWTGFIRDLRYSGEATNRAYYRIWTDFMKNHLDELIEFCDDYYEYAAPSFTHDNTMWGAGDASTYQNVTSNSKTWLRTRANYIYDYLSNQLGYAESDYLEDDENAKIALGDVNDDGTITTADVVCILNFILGIENEDFEFNQADTDGNEIITIADAMYVLNLVGQQKSSNVHRMRLPEADAYMRLTPITLQYGLTADMPVALSLDEGAAYSGVQFDVTLPAGMTLSDVVLPVAWTGAAKQISELAENKFRVSLYASAQNPIPSGTNVFHLMLDNNEEVPNGLLTLSIANGMLVTEEGEDERLNACSVRMEMTTTGISEIANLGIRGGSTLQVESSEDTILHVYSLDGRLVRLCNVPAGKSSLKLPRGIYVVNNQKIIIR